EAAVNTCPSAQRTTVRSIKSQSPFPKRRVRLAALDAKSTVTGSKGPPSTRHSAPPRRPPDPPTVRPNVCPPQPHPPPETPSGPRVSNTGGLTWGTVSKRPDTDHFDGVQATYAGVV